jgi:DNA polymerase III epsilon subunit-like protein
VRAQEDVVDYRTQWSGVRKEDLDGAPSFKVVQQEVADLIKGRIVVGHGLKNDFGVSRVACTTTDTAGINATSSVHSYTRYCKVPTLAKTQGTSLLSESAD